MRSSPSLLLLTLFLLVAATTREAFACPDIDGLVDVNCDRKLEILTFGNSITYGVGDNKPRRGYPGRLRESFPSAKIRNLGNPGERTAQGKSRAARNFKKYPNADYIVILEGVNDYFGSNRSVSNTKSNLLKMVRAGENTGAVVLLSKLTQTSRSFQQPWVKAVNRAIGRHTEIDFFALGKGILSHDKLHPKASGYTRMANLVARRLLAVSEDNRPVDADNDGIYDFAESRFSASRNNADSDGDGLLDGAEVFTYNSRPNDTDSDDDGYSDFEEVTVLRSDPSDPRPSAPQLQSITPLP